MRYNTTTSQFEGYAAGNWGTLGGVKSADQATYISAESAPGAADGNLRFVNCNVQNMILTDTGKLGLGTTAPDVTLTIEATDAIMLPAGTTAERPGAPRQGFVRYNTDTLQFEGYGAGDTWGSLGGVKSTDQLTYISAEASPGANDGILRFYSDGMLMTTISSDSNLVHYGAATISGAQLNDRTLCNMLMVQTEKLTAVAAAIDVDAKTLSNVTRVITSELKGPTSAGINALGTTLSNLNTLEVANITSAASAINMSGKGLSNLADVHMMPAETIYVDARLISMTTTSRTSATCPSRAASRCAAISS